VVKPPPPILSLPLEAEEIAGTTSAGRRRRRPRVIQEEVVATANRGRRALRARIEEVVGRTSPCLQIRADRRGRRRRRRGWCGALALRQGLQRHRRCRRGAPCSSRSSAYRTRPSRSTGANRAPPGLDLASLAADRVMPASIRHPRLPSAWLAASSSSIRVRPSFTACPSAVAPAAHRGRSHLLLPAAGGEEERGRRPCSRAQGGGDRASRSGGGACGSGVRDRER
jgi:hypothetical protein